MVPVFFAVFFVAAAGEELGWQGCAIERLRVPWNALEAAIILGAVWAVWHIVPLVQAHRAVTAVIVVFLWGPETLARYRYAGPGGSEVMR